MVEELTVLIVDAAALAHDYQQPAVYEGLHLAGLHVDAALSRLGGRHPHRRPARPRR